MWGKMKRLIHALKEALRLKTELIKLCYTEVISKQPVAVVLLRARV